MLKDEALKLMGFEEITQIKEIALKLCKNDVSALFDKIRQKVELINQMNSSVYTNNA